MSAQGDLGAGQEAGSRKAPAGGREEAINGAAVDERAGRPPETHRCSGAQPERPALSPLYRCSPLRALILEAQCATNRRLAEAMGKGARLSALEPCSRVGDAAPCPGIIALSRGKATRWVRLSNESAARRAPRHPNDRSSEFAARVHRGRRRGGRTKGTRSETLRLPD